MASFKPQHHKLTNPQLASLIYHDQFDYPLTKSELHKWQLNTNKSYKNIKSYYKNNYYFLAGREVIINKRINRKKYSVNKLKIAKRAANLLSKIPSVRMIAVTGSLAMNNAKKNSDIDLMIMTSKNALWVTRLISFVLLKLNGFSLRRAGDKNEKNKLCLNMWLDESDLIFRKRNICTAHELAQTMLIYKTLSEHERMLAGNKWILNYWPNAVSIKNTHINNLENQSNIFSKFIRHLQALLIIIFELLAYKFQKYYMRNKITRETVTKTRAFFHPNSCSSRIARNFPESCR